MSLEAFLAQRKLPEGAPHALCYAPFVSLNLSPSGNIAVCCATRTYPLGNIRNTSLEEAWNSKRLKGIRTLLAKDVFPPNCTSCKWSIEAGNYHSAILHYFEDKALDANNPWPTQMEFAFSNVCNLGCIMCSGELSSFIQAKAGKPRLPHYYGDAFFEEMRKFLPHLKTATFVGGEPFLQRECFRMWDMMIEMGLDVHCTVVTNGTVYNEKVERVLHALPFTISISMDGVTKETMESIRLNVDFDAFLDNFRKFDAYSKLDLGPVINRRQRCLSISFTPQRGNWHEAADLFLFAEENGAMVYTNQLTEPTQLSLFSLPREDIRRIYESMSARRIEARLEMNRDGWNNLLTELRYHADRDTGIADDVRKRALDSTPMYEAWRLKDEGKPEEALAFALTTTPHDPYFFYKAKILCGEVLTNLGRFEEAKDHVDMAIDLEPDSPESHLLRAWFHHRQGNNTEAAADLDQAEALVRSRKVVDDYIPESIANVRNAVMAAGSTAGR